MGILKDLFGYGSYKSGGKNRCIFCGCILENNDSDTCDCCLDELYENNKEDTTNEKQNKSNYNRD